MVYDLDAVELDRASFDGRPSTIWRYRELLPVGDEKNIVDLGAGYTPLRRCRRLAEALGVENLYLKDDTVNPTNSFKDRPSSVAVSKAIEFGAEAVGCASTGNLAAAVAAHAARAGLPCYVFIPSDTELNKVLQTAVYGARIVSVDGTYDEANRLAAEVAEERGWALANINLRPYYVEGSKSLVFELCEQLGWRAPDSVVVPLGSGALLCSLERGLGQLEGLGLIDEASTRLLGAQGAGCAPIADAFAAGSEEVEPIERPNTIAKSLAIGNPGDGYYALKAIRRSEGAAASVSDGEILDAIRLLGRTEGVFAEPAGGVTVAVLRKLLDEGAVDRDDEVVCLITGSGFKAGDSILRGAPAPRAIAPTLEAFAEAVAR